MEDLSEKEQLEAMRAWWKENGRYVISGILLGVALLLGWNEWKDYQQTSRLEASALYETLAVEANDGDLDASEAAASNLYDNYASTTYAALARLAMAKLYMEQGRDQDAADALNALVSARGNSEVKMVGRLRLAKVYLYQDKHQEVVELLAGFEDSSFAARYDELLGDAYLALGQVESASAAYQRAMLDDVNAPTVDRALVQMKIVDLPVDVAVDEPAADDAAISETADPVD